MLKKDDKKFILKGLLIWLTSLLIYEGRQLPSFFRLYLDQSINASFDVNHHEMAQTQLLGSLDVGRKLCPELSASRETVATSKEVVMPQKRIKQVRSKKKRLKAKLKPDEKINVNLASREDLVRLPGVGKAIAKRIITYRSQKGEFRQLGELQNVKGLGKKKLNLLAEHITFK